MSKYNNFSALPFYGFMDGEENAWDCRKWYAWGQIYPLIVPDHLIPFFIKTNNAKAITGVYVYKLKEKSGTSVEGSDFEELPGNLLRQFEGAGLSLDGNDILFKPNFTKILDDGYYYIDMLVVEDNPTHYYSDIFKVESNMGNNFLKIEWRNYKDNSNKMDLIPYYSSYMNRIYVESTLGMPTYEYEEEGEKRMGYFYPTKQISYKKYKFVFTAPEYLCDVLRLVPMSDEIKVTDNEGIELRPTDFNVEFSWLEGGHYAKVECEFTTDTVVKKIGGMHLYKGRDFNLDFNKDYNSLTLDQ